MAYLAEIIDKFKAALTYAMSRSRVHIVDIHVGQDWTHIYPQTWTTFISKLIFD